MTLSKKTLRKNGPSSRGQQRMPAWSRCRASVVCTIATRAAQRRRSTRKFTRRAVACAHDHTHCTIDSVERIVDQQGSGSARTARSAEVVLLTLRSWQPTRRRLPSGNDGIGTDQVLATHSGSISTPRKWLVPGDPGPRLNGAESAKNTAFA